MAKSTAVSQPMQDNDADDYQAQDDARTLIRAEEVRGDKQRHGKAHKHLKKQHEAIKRAMNNPFSRVMK